MSKVSRSETDHETSYSTTESFEQFRLTVSISYTTDHEPDNEQDPSIKVTKTFHDKRPIMKVDLSNIDLTDKASAPEGFKLGQDFNAIKRLAKTLIIEFEKSELQFLQDYYHIPLLKPECLKNEKEHQNMANAFKTFIQTSTFDEKTFDDLTQQVITILNNPNNQQALKELGLLQLDELSQALMQDFKEHLIQYPTVFFAFKEDLKDHFAQDELCHALDVLSQEHANKASRTDKK
jgi:hypothetical protein